MIGFSDEKVSIMHLSREIQKKLNKLGSAVELESTIDGTFPARYSFCRHTSRRFRAEFASTDQLFSIVLFERTDKQQFEDCFARGLFNSVDRLSSVIDLWVDKQQDITVIKNKFDELELYEEFECRSSNNDINKAWHKVKNMFFNSMTFWKYSEWENRYNVMLTEARGHVEFENYFPFTSHDWLRFSIDKELRETWLLDTYIIPVMYSPEIPESVGQFYVSYNDQPMGGKYFKTASEALDFYAMKLKEIKPIKW